MKVCSTVTFAAKKPKVDPTALFKLSYGLYVLTVGGDKPNGCISNTVFQVSENPTRIAVSCQKGNLTRELIEKSGVFNISVLSEDVPFETIRHFGMQSGRDVDKFAEFKDFKTAANGVPYISANTNAFISVKVASATDLDSHMLFVCDITESQVLSKDSSCTYAHYHAAVKPKK